jgi:hypothetical protein
VSDPGRTIGYLSAAANFIGAALALITLFQVSRYGGMNPNFRYRPWDRELRRKLYGEMPVESSEVTRIRGIAQALVARRWLLLFAVGAITAQTWGDLPYTGDTRLRFAIAFDVFMICSGVLVERQARVGAAFLRRHPEPSAAGAGPPMVD